MNTFADPDPDVFISEVYQLRDKLSDLRESVSTERLTTIILDTLPVEKYSKIKFQVIRDPDLSLEENITTMKIISSIILKGRRFPNGVKSRTVKVVMIAVASQQCVIVVENLRCLLFLHIITAKSRGIE